MQKIGELTKGAEVSIASERFVGGFRLLTLAQERALSDGPRLETDDAINLGDSLVAAGHALFNYYIDDNGRDLARSFGSASDAAGRIKFQEAAEVFKYAIEYDPSDIRAYLGLSEMQWELGQDSTDTISQLEAMLEAQPIKDSANIRLEIARRHVRLDDDRSVIKSYAKAVELSVGQYHFRHKVASALVEYLHKSDSIDPDDLQLINSACLRAMISDPKEPYYRDLYSYVEKLNQAALR